MRERIEEMVRALRLEARELESLSCAYVNGRPVRPGAGAAAQEKRDVAKRLAALLRASEDQ